MIATLRGQILELGPTSCVLEVAGVGYLVQTTKQMLANFEIGSAAFVHTSQIFREDSVQLFGFESREQLALFELLRSVSGVGPKTALAILSTLNPSEISRAVTDEDAQPFESVSGIGGKTAKLITITLAGKLKTVVSAKQPIELNILTALQGLGWSAKVAEPVVSKVLAENTDAEISTLIRKCLILLGK